MKDQQGHSEERCDKIKEYYVIMSDTEDAIEDEINGVVMLGYSEFELKGLNNNQQQNRLKGNQVSQKETIVSFADTHPNPGTVMVYLLNTNIAYLAMCCSWRAIQPTRLTILYCHKMRFNAKIVMPKSSYNYFSLQEVTYSFCGMGQIVGYNGPIGSILGIIPGSMKISERWRILFIPQMIEVAITSQRVLSWADAMKQMDIDPWQSTRTAKKLRGCERKASRQCLPSLVATLRLELILSQVVFVLETIIIILMHHQQQGIPKNPMTVEKILLLIDRGWCI